MYRLGASTRTVCGPQSPTSGPAGMIHGRSPLRASVAGALDACPMILWSYSPFALERRAQPEWAGIADLLCDGSDGCIRLAQHVGGQGETPGGEVRHGRFANHFGEPA